MINLALTIVFHLLVLSHAKRNVLLSACHYFKSHSTSLAVLAERLCNDPEFNCIIVAEQGTQSKWKNVNSQMLYLSDSEVSEKFENLTRDFMTATEAGELQGVDIGREILNEPINYWIKDHIYEKLSQIGIDIAICDSLNLGCLIAIHKLNISVSVNYLPLCNSWGFTGIHEGDWNYIPFGSIAGLTEKMTFLQRLTNFFITKMTKLIGKTEYEATALTHVPFIQNNDWRSNTLVKREALFLMACIPSFSYPEYLPPNFLHVGPIINRKVNPLSQNIFQFIHSYTKVVYVSFGSIKTNFNYEILLNVARMMPEVGFVISHSQAQSIDKSNLPPNSLILPWVNQTDLLGSGKIDVFVTHAGWNSICESLLHAVPMIALGWTGDQKDYSILVHKRKVGRAILDKREFSADLLVNEILQVINNSNYKKNAEKFSRLIKNWDSEDKVIKAIKVYLEVGIENFVVEQEFTLSWIQYTRLDIYAFIAFVGMVIFFIIYKSLRVLFLKFWFGSLVKNK